MNAFEQAKSLMMVSKIEAILHLFRVQFPEIIADLKPWLNNEETEYFEDSNSIDIGLSEVVGSTHFSDILSQKPVA